MNRSSLLLSLSLTVATLVALPLCGWFTIHSSAFASYVRTTLDRETRPGVLSFESLELGPTLGEVTLYDVVLRARTGEPALVAQHARVRLNLDSFEAGKHLLVLPIDEVEISDFELTLAWDRFGDFNLGDPFRNRAFGLGTEKPPPFKFKLDMPAIALNRGRLHLEWPGFGFHFDQIVTKGAVHVAKDGLFIDVPALDAAASAAWIRNAPEALQKAVAAHMPDNAVSVASPGLRLPFDSVTIRNFRWDGDGFQTRLNIAGAGDVPVDVTGSMSFGREGVDHALDVRVGVPGPLLEAASQGMAAGDVSLSLKTKGRDLASRFLIEDLSLSRLQVGGMALTEPRLTRLDIDASGSHAGLKLDLAAGRIQVKTVDVTSATGAIRVDVGCDDCRGEKMLAGLLNPPDSPLGWLGLFPAAVEAKLDVPSLAAAAITIGRRRIDSVKLRDLAFSGKVPEFGLRLEELSTDTLGSASLQASASLAIGFSERSLKASVTLTLKNVDLAVLREALGHPEGLGSLAGPQVSGKLVFAGDLFRPDSFALATVEVADSK